MDNTTTSSGLGRQRRGSITRWQIRDIAPQFRIQNDDVFDLNNI